MLQCALSKTLCMKSNLVCKIPPCHIVAHLNSSNKILFNISYQAQHPLAGLILCALKRSSAREKKRINEAMLKMLQKKANQQGKIFMSQPTKTSTIVTSADFGSGQPKTTVNKSIIMREKTVSALLLRELQETIDSGQAGEELANLQVAFTSARLKGKHNCFVTWESQGYSSDLHIQEVLERASGLLRHIIMHSHIVGIVPTFKFVIGSGIQSRDKVVCILDSGDLDVGNIDKENMQSLSVHEGTNELTDDEKRKSIEPITDDPTFHLFQVDNANLKEKILARKYRSKVEDINSKLIEVAIPTIDVKPTS